MNAFNQAKFRRQLLLLLLVAAAIRLPSLWQELPPYLFCDEGMFFGQVKDLLKSGGWLPSDYRSGGFNIYPVLILARLLRHHANILQSDTSILIFGRFVLDVCVGSAGVIAISLAAKKFTTNQRVALLSAWLYALAPGLKAFSRYWYPDHYIYALASLFLLALAYYVERVNLRTTVFLGVALALVISTKYTGLVLAIPLGLHELSKLRERTLNLTSFRESMKRLVIILLVAATGFLLMNPGSVFRRHEFIRDWTFNFKNYGGRSNGLSGTIFYASNLFVRGLGITTLIMLLAGIWCLRAKFAGLVVPLMSVPLVVIVLFGRSGLAINRNIAIAIPFLILVCAAGVDHLMSSQRKLVRPVAAVTLAIGPAFAETSSAFLHDLSLDSRVLAEKWLNNNIPAGARVGSNEFCSGVAPISRPDVIIVVDPLVSLGLDWYVINSYWDSPFFESYGVVGEQKYFHFYRFNRPKNLSIGSSLPDLKSVLPDGYEIVKQFSSNGPDVIVLHKKN